MLRFFYIGIGGAIGAISRYFISGLTYRYFDSGFPWGTMSVNLAGSLVTGLLWGMFESLVVSQNVRLMLFIGFLGSFTTFSTFSLENFNLLRDGEYGFLVLNVSVSILSGIMLVFAGYFAGRYIFDMMR